MYKYIMLIITLFCINILTAQVTNISTIENSIIDLGAVADNNEDFSEFSNLKPLLENVNIVMMGEQSHGEATTYETKIKLIKYLHQELGYDLLVFESGFFECKKAWDLIEKGEEVRTAMGKSIFDIWSTTKDIKPLANYIELTKKSENPLRLAGFDNQFTGKYASGFFLADLEKFLQRVLPEILETEDWSEFSESIQLITKFKKASYKQFKKSNQEDEMKFILRLISEISKTENNPESKFWIQALKSTRTYISNVAPKSDFRDKQMADNLIWIKENNPKSKIICWGATGHFIYNSKDIRMKSVLIQTLAGNYYKKVDMMGEYVKNKYQDKVYTIGFTAYQGEFGLFKGRKIKAPKEGTFEYVLGQAKYDNYLLPLKGLNIDGMESRPLGNFYMKTDINNVMDAVVFNRNMVRPKLDRNFFLEMYPENKWIKPEVINTNEEL